LMSELEVLPHFVHLIESMISPIAVDLAAFYSRVAVGDVLIGGRKHRERAWPVVRPNQAFKGSEAALRR